MQQKKKNRKQREFESRQMVNNYANELKARRRFFFLILGVIVFFVLMALTSCKSTTPAHRGDYKKPLVKSKHVHSDRGNPANWNHSKRGQQ